MSKITEIGAKITYASILCATSACGLLPSYGLTLYTMSTLAHNNHILAATYATVTTGILDAYGFLKTCNFQDELKKTSTELEDRIKELETPLDTERITWEYLKRIRGEKHDPRLSSDIYCVVMDKEFENIDDAIINISEIEHFNFHGINCKGGSLILSYKKDNDSYLQTENVYAVHPGFNETLDRMTKPEQLSNLTFLNPFVSHRYLGGLIGTISKDQNQEE